MNPAPRITTRIDRETQEILKEAMRISGVPSINSFVLQSALKEAKLLIEKERLIRLDEEASKRLMQALDNPPAPNAKLRQLFQSHPTE